MSPEDGKHHIERQKVVDGADGTNVNHEVANELDIPVARLSDKAGIHVISGNGHLGEIIEKIVEQDLRGKHRKKRKKNRCRRHAEHVAEVRARAHEQILHDVAERLASFDDSLVKDVEAALHQNNVGSVFGDIHRRRHGNTNVGAVKGWRVIDSVAKVTNRMFA